MGFWMTKELSLFDAFARSPNSMYLPAACSQLIWGGMVFEGRSGKGGCALGGGFMCMMWQLYRKYWVNHVFIERLRVGD